MSSPQPTAVAPASPMVEDKPSEQQEEEEEQAEEEEETPTETLYIQNLNEKIKPPVLKATLTNLFKHYGTILSVTAHQNLRMRGQAFVAFESPSNAQKAKKEVVGFPLYGKPMIIGYAKTKSDSVVQFQGDGDEAKLKAWIEVRKERKKKTRYDNPLKKKFKVKRASHNNNNNAMVDSTVDAVGGAQKSRPNVMMPDEYLPPNKILFIQNLPTDDQDDLRQQLTALFSRYPNLHEIRLIPTKKDIAFVEYTDEDSATVAKDALHNFKLVGDQKIKITFARK